MALTQLSSRPETGFNRRRRNVPLLCSSRLSSPISWSEEGTKSGWENMLFHWVKIYYQGNDCCRVQKRTRGGLGEGAVVHTLGDGSPRVAQGERFLWADGRDVQLRLWTRARKVSPLLFTGEEATQEEGESQTAKGDHVRLWNSVRHTCTWAFGSGPRGAIDGSRGAAVPRGPRDPGRECFSLGARLVPTS